LLKEPQRHRRRKQKIGLRSSRSANLSCRTARLTHEKAPEFFRGVFSGPLLPDQDDFPAGAGGVAGRISELSDARRTTISVIR